MRGFNAEPDPYSELFQVWKRKVKEKQEVRKFFENKLVYFLRTSGPDFSFPERLNHFLPTLHLQMKFKDELLRFLEQNDLKDPVASIWIRKTSSIEEAYDAMVFSYYLRDLRNERYLLLRLNWDANYLDPFASWSSYLIGDSPISTFDLVAGILIKDFYNFLIKHRKIEGLVYKIVSEDEIPFPTPILDASARDLLIEKFEDSDFNHDDFFETLFNFTLKETCAPSKIVVSFLHHFWSSIPLDENVLARLLNISLSMAIRILESKDKALLHTSKLKTPKWENFKIMFTDEDEFLEIFNEEVEDDRRN